MTEQEKTFYKYISRILSEDDRIPYEWKKDKKEIVFKKLDEEGFDIALNCEDDNYLYLSTNLGYYDFYYYESLEQISDILPETMGLVRDLLSPNMRIVEKLSNSKPYKWLLQCKKDNDWITERVSGLVFYNYLGKRIEKIYSNNTLPPRDNMYE
ncbi:hypothetical protein GF357_02500 [Candidatus Dojkabacteria bacterium]|nr:hypothetical protein [Candidatus Dojkabacteria bacterium]